MAKSILTWKEPNSAKQGAAATEASSLGSPECTRRDIQSAYERYVLGIDRYPRIKIEGTEIDKLPKKTQPVASALIRAWERIDCDEAWWKDVLDIMGISLKHRVENGVFNNPISAFSRVGRNVVRVGVISPPAEVGGPNQAFFKSYTTPEFNEQFEGVELHVGDGQKVKIEGGGIVLGDAVPDLAVVRDSGHVASIWS